MTEHTSESGYYDNQPNPGGLVSSLSFRVRKRMFAAMMSITGADERTAILDVGVTNDTRQESNFLEKLYPYSEKITAVGMEDASFLQEQHPGVTYVRADGTNLPFRDKSFDLVTGFAVIEHVGSRPNQRRFVRELCRVGRSCIITTPNRGYPMEVHTMMPFLHWLPPETHRKALRLLGKAFYAREENLNLLDAVTLRGMFPESMTVSEHHHRLLGVVSNLFFYAQRPGAGCSPATGASRHVP
jgi:2-polyprenyl-3-methyl-5-hydroxy-6-metoxy-1,4-benzoquinol methylase